MSNPSAEDAVQVEREPTTEEVALRRLLQTPDGVALLKWLGDMYDGDALLDVSSDRLTAFRLGQRDVYRELLFQSQKGQTTDE